MRAIIALFVGLACHLTLVAAECPNACSAHGKCGAYDMCLCYRNWMSNDCSERICQFGLAHVDTPKGDLDASSGVLADADTTVVVNDALYPFGTTERYPATKDLDGTILKNTAHEYRECSNKGLCDRQTGNCVCFEGYEGSACQRAGCPSNADGVCSGHGTCETIKEIAARDFNNVYKLWDEHSTMGCVCDPGYSGPDCADRVCKWGADPLYYDDAQNIRYSNWTYQFYTLAANTKLSGNYSITFFDAHGENWQTRPLDWDATCEEVTAALEDLPNNAIPKDSVRCFKSPTPDGGLTPGQELNVDPIYDASMYVHSKYTIAFPQNPGKLQQISINKFLDGSRPTLYSDESAASTLSWHIYPNGFIGENVDMVPDLCEDVMVKLRTNGLYHTLSFPELGDVKLLKKCLGDSDGNADNNVDVYNWDHGSTANPHLIKLVDATQDSTIVTVDNLGDHDVDYALSKYPVSRLCSDSASSLCAARDPPGFYAVLYYIDNADPTPDEWRVLTRAANDYGPDTSFHVFTTKGHLQLVNPDSAAFTTRSDDVLATRTARYYSNVVYFDSDTAGYNGNIDCETTVPGSSPTTALDCIRKDDYVMILNTLDVAGHILYNTADQDANPVYPNLYQVKKIGRVDKDANWGTEEDAEYRRQQMVLDYSLNTNFVRYNSLSPLLPKRAQGADTSASVYKFYPPPAASQYAYAGECSHRGICNTKSGLCQCFPGYSGDNCGEVNALSN